jgi:hypothetical protein
VSVAWSSSYLERGVPQDEIVLHEVRIDERSVTCRFSVVSGPDGPNPYHLTGISTHRVVTQCGMAFVHHTAALAHEAIGDIFELQYAVEYRKMITEPANRTLTLCFEGRRRMRNAYRWSFTYDVERGAFRGALHLVSAASTGPSERE